MLIWMASGMGGYLFSSLINDGLVSSCVPCLDGIIGSFLAFLTINWVALKN